MRASSLPTQPPTEGIDPDKTITEMTWIVMPGQTNALGSVFGGQVMAWIDVCAAVSAQRFARSAVVTAAMDELAFRAPIRQGDICVLRSMVNWSGRSSMEVGVRVESENPLTGERVHTSTAYLTFVALTAPGERKVLTPLAPSSPEAVRRWHEARERCVARRAARDARAAARAKA